MAKLPILANNPYMQKAREYLGVIAANREAQKHQEEISIKNDEINRLTAELAQERRERKQEREAMREIVTRLESGDFSDIEIDLDFK